MIDFNEIDTKVAQAIIDKAKLKDGEIIDEKTDIDKKFIEKHVISFAEIQDKTGVNKYKLGEYLSRIGSKCVILGLPNLSAMVVYKGTTRVGDGYCEFDKDFNDHLVDVRKEQKRVILHKQWEELFEHVVPIENDILFNSAEKMKYRTIKDGKRNYGDFYLREQDLKLKNECLEGKAKVCIVCGFDPVKKYGKGFENLIEVHLLNPPFKYKKKEKTTPNDPKPCDQSKPTADDSQPCEQREPTANDFVLVCPDCHRALHSKPDGLYTTDELKDLIEKINK